MTDTTVDASVEHRPRFAEGARLGVGLVGCGHIAKLAHLPAYSSYGVDVVGVYDALPEATAGIRDEFPVVGRVFGSLEELFADPRVAVVDIATHPAARLELVAAAIEAGKHVLSQKPFAPTVAAARELVEHADRRGVRLAVNQNGRWAPPWRIATRLVEQGRVGDVSAVTHLFEHDFGWTVGTQYDAIPHFVLYDFAVHWIDITRCWFADKEVTSVRALEYRTPTQAAGQVAPWGALVVIQYADGSNALIRSVGSATRRPGNPFWIHGSEGTIRGSIRKGTDFVSLERDGDAVSFGLEGEWLPDGFAGTLAELCSAVVEEREPYNSARHNLLTLQMTLAACRSAEEDGRPVTLDEIG